MSCSTFVISVGTQLTVMAISRDQNQNNSLVYDEQAITVSNNMQVTLNLVAITDLDLLNKLSLFK